MDEANLDNRAAAEVWDWQALLESPYHAPPWIVEQVLPEKGSVLIAAKEGMGKSILGLQLALAISTGSDFLGFNVPVSHKVLYVQCEGDLGDTAQRGHDMTLMLPSPERGMLSWAFLLKKKINTKAGFEGLRELAEMAGLHEGVIFIDPVYPTIRGGMKDDEPAAEWTDNLNRVCHEFKSATVIFEHEHREIRDSMGQRVKEGLGEKLFGSYVWKAWASYGFEMRHSTGKGPLLFQAWKQRRPTILSDEPLKLTMVEPSPLGFILAEEGVTSSMATVKMYLKVTGLSMSKDDLGLVLVRDKKRGMKRTAVQDAVSTLEAKGDIRVVPDTWPRQYTYNYEVTSQGGSNE